MSWVEELEGRIFERHQVLVAPLMTRRKSGAQLMAHNITESDVFVPSKQTSEEWSTSNIGSVYVDESPDSFMSTIVLKGQEVPDWLYGFISHQNNTCLPENGTADECKEGILAVMEESAASVVRRVSQCLDSYSIKIITVEVDLLGEHMVLHAITDKPVMQVNTIMGNKVVRGVMPPRAKVCVNTHVEHDRRTDDYLKNKPALQEISRDFYYEDGTIVRAEPQHWSAGSTYEPGDILRIGSVAIRVEDELNNPWADVAFDGDPIAGRDDPGRSKNGTPFRPGERAYWNARRNR
jgi:hypothetical protein